MAWNLDMSLNLIKGYNTWCTNFGQHQNQRCFNSKATYQICDFLNIADKCKQRYDSFSKYPTANVAHASLESDWYPETPASHHITQNLADSSLSNAYTRNDKVTVGNGRGLKIFNTSSSTLSTPTKSFNLNNILHVPTVHKNLLSIKQFSRDNKCFFEFYPIYFVVKRKT